MGKECLHAFRKSENEEIRISAGKYRDKHYFDIRLFFKPSENQEEDMRPTRKGVTLPIDFLSEIEKGITLTKKYRQSIEV